MLPKARVPTATSSYGDSEIVGKSTRDGIEHYHFQGLQA